MTDVDIAVINGNLDQLKTCIRKDIFPSQQAINSAIENNHIEIVNYLQAIYDELSFSDHFSSITRRNFLTEEIKANNINLSNINVNVATQEGSLELLKICITNGIYPSQEAIDNAARNEHFNILNYLETLYETLSFSEHFPSIMRMQCHPNKDLVNYAISDNKINLLKWFLDRNISPDKNSIYFAIKNNHYEALKLIEDFEYQSFQREVAYGT